MIDADTTNCRKGGVALILWLAQLHEDYLATPQKPTKKKKRSKKGIFMWQV